MVFEIPAADRQIVANFVKSVNGTQVGLQGAVNATLKKFGANSSNDKDRDTIIGHLTTLSNGIDSIIVQEHEGKNEDISSKKSLFARRKSSRTLEASSSQTAHTIQDNIDGFIQYHTALAYMSIPEAEKAGVVLYQNGKALIHPRFVEQVRERVKNDVRSQRLEDNINLEIRAHLTSGVESTEYAQCVQDATHIKDRFLNQLNKELTIDVSFIKNMNEILADQKPSERSPAARIAESMSSQRKKMDTVSNIGLYLQGVGVVEQTLGDPSGDRVRAVEGGLEDTKLKELAKKISEKCPLALSTSAGRAIIQDALQKGQTIIENIPLLQEAQKASLREIGALLAINAGDSKKICGEANPKQLAETFKGLSRINRLLAKEDVKDVLEGKKTIEEISSNIQQQGTSLIGIDYDQTFHPLHMDSILYALQLGDLAKIVRMSDKKPEKIALTAIAKQLGLVPEHASESEAIAAIAEAVDERKFNIGANGECEFRGADEKLIPVTNQIEKAVYEALMDKKNGCDHERAHLENTDRELTLLLQNPNNSVYILSKSRFSPFIECSIERFERSHPEYKGRTHVIGSYEAYQELTEEAKSDYNSNYQGLGNQTWKNVPTTYDKEKVHMPQMIYHAQLQGKVAKRCVLVDDDHPRRQGDLENAPNLRRAGAYIQTYNSQTGALTPFKALDIEQTLEKSGTLGLEIVTQKLPDVSQDASNNLIVRNTEARLRRLGAQDNTIDSLLSEIEQMVQRTPSPSPSQEVFLDEVDFSGPVYPPSPIILPRTMSKNNSLDNNKGSVGVSQEARPTPPTPKPRSNVSLDNNKGSVGVSQEARPTPPIAKPRANVLNSLPVTPPLVGNPEPNVPKPRERAFNLKHTDDSIASTNPQTTKPAEVDKKPPIRPRSRPVQSNLPSTLLSSSAETDVTQTPKGNPHGGIQ